MRLEDDLGRVEAEDAGSTAHAVQGRGAATAIEQTAATRAGGGPDMVLPGHFILPGSGSGAAAAS